MPQQNDLATGLSRVGSITGMAPRDVDGTAPDAKSLGRSETISSDLCVIGAGSGGLSVAAAGAQLGVKVVLVEKHKMGGDCLNYGCVPSKALIAAGKRAKQLRDTAAFGIAPVEAAVDYKAVHDHIKRVIAAIAPNDSIERFTGLGVHVIQATARFIDRRTVTAGDLRIKARRFVIATGSSPAMPPIPGLDQVPSFTNETIFDNQEKIGHLIVIGGGPVGLELAQAHLRLGSRVTVLEALKAMNKDDPELADVVLKHLRSEGVVIREGVWVERVEGGPGSVRVHVSEGATASVVEGTHLLVAIGRKPNVSDLGLEAAGIRYNKHGIQVNKGLMTSNSKVFAIGDVAGGPLFTHIANYHAGIVIRRALFRLPATVNNDFVPWVTFTDPEIAHVGLTEETVRQRFGGLRVYRWPYYENDRAQIERTTEGFIKVVANRKGKLLGASIVGAHAGELIQMWSLALSQGLNVKAMTQWISPYPTLSEINKRAAFGYYSSAAQSLAVRQVIRWLAKLG
jgi:pyruvate/2-oxoglutarate dehydrogenase complex dihydrolipoamide dehydrogenase (E3) component